ncbi:MAG: hypothetical protein JWN78_3239 [Bacteroidota bacterium]|nr:hypothetical protein [Bacteroidota bacterium]
MNNETVKKYLSGEISAEERNAIERKIEDDYILKESIEGLEEFSEVNKDWKINETIIDLANRIDKRSVQLSNKKIFSLNTLRYAAAACIIGIFSMASWRIFFINEDIDEDAIYTSYFKPLTDPYGTIRGDNNNSEDTQAIQAYEKENYFEAVRYYEKLVGDDPQNVKNNLFLGISFMATNQPKKAIGIFNQIITSVEFHDDIQWYLGLAYIKSKDIQKAKDTLGNLALQESYYQKEAEEVLDKLNGKITASK